VLVSRSTPIPLVGRPAGAILFRRPGQDVTAGAFAAAAACLAASLPATGPAINVCMDRYAFALAFAAACLRGHASVLTSDASPGRLAALRAQYPDGYTVDDARTWLTECRSADIIPSIPADQPAAIVFTSGSTGAPVGHCKTWGALAERSIDAAAAFGLDPAHPATLVGTVPPQHMYGFETTVLWPLHAPLSVWCGPVFYPADTRAALSACPTPRLLVTTPLQLRGLLEGPALPGMDRVISATAPLDQALAERAERAWNTTVSEIFGATEVGSIAARCTANGPAWTLYPRITLREQDGRLLVEAPYASPTPLDDALDIGVDRRFTLRGRRSDVVKLAGRRASLAGLNSILLGIDGVLDGVFVAPDAACHHAARMTAFVVAPGRDADAILAELRALIDPAFLPRRVVQVDRLPRNDLGKLPLQALQPLRAGS